MIRSWLYPGIPARCSRACAAKPIGMNIADAIDEGALNPALALSPALAAGLPGRTDNTSSECSSFPRTHLLVSAILMPRYGARATVCDSDSVFESRPTDASSSDGLNARGATI